MENWTLDEHQTLDKFRGIMSSLSVIKNRHFHLFLTPPYASPPKSTTCQSYLFYTQDSNDNIFINNLSQDIQMHYENGVLTPIKGFATKFHVNVILTTYCTSVDGVSFNIHEMDNDIYDTCRQIHPLYLKLLDSYSDPIKSTDFLLKTFPAKSKVVKLVKGIDDAIFSMDINQYNMEDFVQKLHVSIEQVASAVFDIPEINILPVSGKQKLNYLVFNALTSKCHSKLMLAYAAKYDEQNRKAQKFMHQHVPTIEADQEKLTSAAHMLKGVLSAASPGAAIKQVIQFFDAVVGALPGIDVAADDILPAICVGMTKDYSFSSHVVSFFTYLAEIWPSSGLDERTSYVLVTCSIAAAHLADPPAPPPAPPKDDTTQETIDLLEDLLNSI